MIKKLHTTGPLSAADIPALFKKEGIEYEGISVLNWPEAFPYKPEVNFALAHTGDALLIHYKVEERSTGAACGEDGGRVWEDSCVEFFCRTNPSRLTYYNLECNCIGKLKFCCGDNRDEREDAPAEALAMIDRWSSLGCEPFQERAAGPWEACLLVPAKAFFRDSIESFDGKTILANLYKCGDLLQTPHFLTYAPIDKPSPDFHRPEFFVPFTFEKLF